MPIAYLVFDFSGKTHSLCSVFLRICIKIKLC